MKKSLLGILSFFIIIFGIGFHVKADPISVDFLHMFDNHGTIMLLIDPLTGSIEYANIAALEYYGYSNEELLQMSIDDINILSEEEVQMEMELAASEARNYFIFEHELKSKEVRTVEVYSYPIEYDGSVLLFSIIIDIENRLMLEQLNRTLTLVISVSSIVALSLLLILFFALRKNHLTLLQQHTSLQISNNMRQTFFDAQENMVYIKNKENKYVLVNPAYQNYIGLGKEEILDKDDNDLHLINQLHQDNSQEVLSSNETENIYKYIIRQDQRYFELTKFIVEIKEGEFGNAGYIRDITETKIHEKMLEEAGNRDLLTGLYNRNYFESFLSHYEVNGKLPIGVILLDVNGLKFMNDVFGHAYGDLLLKQMARTLENCFQKDVTIARYGGDEFIVVITNTTAIETEMTANQVKTAFQKFEHAGINGSVSIGTVFIDNIVTSLEDAIDEAESHMYTAKVLERKTFKKEAVMKLTRKLHHEIPIEKSHAENTSKLAYDFAKYCGLTESDAISLKNAAYYHDIGKVVLLDKIDFSRKPLNKEEEVLLRSHPLLSFRILNYSDDYADIASIVLSHHERYDGKGYPKNIKKDEIPLLSRILSIVVIFDTLTNNKANQKALSFTDAIEEIKRNLGKQFDPDYGNQFIEFITNKKSN